MIERLQEHQECCNPEEILVGYAHAGIDQKKTLRNIERFATEVMPHFQKAVPVERRSSEADGHPDGKTSFNRR